MLDLGPTLTMACGETVTAPLPVIKLYSKRMKAALPTHMSDDYISYLSERIAEEIHIESIKDDIHTANVSGLASAKEKDIAIKKHLNDIAIWKHNNATSLINRADMTAVLGRLKHFYSS